MKRGNEKRRGSGKGTEKRRERKARKAANENGERKKKQSREVGNENVFPLKRGMHPFTLFLQLLLVSIPVHVSYGCQCDCNPRMISNTSPIGSSSIPRPPPTNSTCTFPQIPCNGGCCPNACCNGTCCPSSNQTCSSSNECCEPSCQRDVCDVPNGCGGLCACGDGKKCCTSSPVLESTLCCGVLEICCLNTCCPEGSGCEILTATCVLRP